MKREKGLCGVADRFITAAKVCDCVVSGLVDRRNSGMWSRGWAVAPKYSVPVIKTFCQCLSSLIVPWNTNSRLWRIPIENNKHPNFEWRGQGRGADSFVLRNYPIQVQCLNNFVADCLNLKSGRTSFRKLIEFLFLCLDVRPLVAFYLLCLTSSYLF